MAIQLDLFLDSRSVVLANEVVAALTARDVRRATSAIAALRQYDASHEQLPMLDRLALRIALWKRPASESGEVARAARWLDEEMREASTVLGAGMQTFMESFYLELAQITGGIAYDSAHPEAHCAWQFLRSGKWAQAEEAALIIPNASECPDALYWLAIARYRNRGLDAARPALFALAMRAQDRFAALLEELGDEVLGLEWDAFQDACESESMEPLAAWFPAWYLVEYPAAARELENLALPGSAPGRAARQVLRLIDLERQGIGPRLIAEREKLRALNPGLFRLYLRRRTVRHG
ncbi:MAG: hypothetical protein ACKVQA_19060 [Burkholderiales bacterium]